jgi:hypothetical protein
MEAGSYCQSNDFWTFFNGMFAKVLREDVLDSFAKRRFTQQGG